MNDEDNVKACAAHFDSLVGNTRFKLNDTYRGPQEVLIVNAALGDNEKLMTTEPKRMEEYLDTNVVGLHRVLTHMIPLSKHGKEKKIFIMSSSSTSFNKNLKEPEGLVGPYVSS